MLQDVETTCNQAITGLTDAVATVLDPKFYYENFKMQSGVYAGNIPITLGSITTIDSTNNVRTVATDPATIAVS